MTIIKKTSLAVALAAAYLVTTPALAGIQQDINVLDGAGNVIASDVFKFQWTDANAVAVGKGPFGSDPFATPNPFSFLYQSSLTSFLDANNNTIFGAQDRDYEFTVAANLIELTVPTNPPSATTVNFDSQSGTISIFFDDGIGSGSGTRSNAATGAGFTDGVEVARFTIIGGISSFTLQNSGQGTGSTIFDFELVTAVDFVNADYLQGVDAPIFDLHFTSQLAYPPVGTQPSRYFTSTTDALSPYQPYTVDTSCSALPATGTCDLYLQVQGSNTFTRVPEPGTIVLLASGLLGLGFSARRSGKIMSA